MAYKNQDRKNPPQAPDKGHGGNKGPHNPQDKGSQRPGEKSPRPDWPQKKGK